MEEQMEDRTEVVLNGNSCESAEDLARKKMRRKKFICACIPAMVVAVMWLIIIVANIISGVARGQSKFDVSVGTLEYAPPTYIQFDVSVTNSSEFALSYFDISFRFVDKTNGTKIGTYKTYATSTIPSGEFQTYTVEIDYGNFTPSGYAYLLNSNLKNIDVECEITRVMFVDGKLVDYENGSWFSGFYVFLLLFCVVFLVVWALYIYATTYCKKCKTILAVKVIGTRELGRSDVSWNEKKTIRGKSGNKVYEYDERVHGEMIQYEHKCKCQCCGNITYRRSSRRVAK